MDRRSRITFGLLVVAQAAHSIEEYVFGLYEVFALARFASGLVSSDLATGFAILNGAFVAFGAWCLLYPVRLGWPAATPLAWLWVAIESGNGVLHPVLAAVAGGYFPGVATAPVLLFLALSLAMMLLSARSGGLHGDVV